MKKSINYYMRSLHRDIGFFVLGLTVIYAISGIVLIFRRSTFFKYEKIVRVELAPNLSKQNLKAELKINKQKVIEKTDSLYVFNTGSYNRKSGIAIYTVHSYPAIIQKINTLHMASNETNVYWATTIYGILLLFLAVSSLWMYKPKSKLFKRGIVLSIAGLIIAVVMLFL